MPESNLKSKLQSLGSYVIGLGMLALFIMLPVAMFWGIAAVSAFLYPLFSVLASISILIFILAVLPLSLFHKPRLHLAVISLILSYICGATVWMYSFLIIIGYLGWFAILLVFLFYAVAPIATIGLFIKGQWTAGFSILIGILFTFGMRFYGIWLENLYNRKIQRNFDFIDTESKILE